MGDLSVVMEEALGQIESGVQSTHDTSVSPAAQEHTADPEELKLKVDQCETEEDYEAMGRQIRRELSSLLNQDDASQDLELMRVVMQLVANIRQQQVAVRQSGEWTPKDWSGLRQGLLAASVASVTAVLAHQHLLREGKTEEFVKVVVASVSVGTALGVGGAVANELVSQYVHETLKTCKFSAPAGMEVFCQGVHGKDALQVFAGFLGPLVAGLSIDMLILFFKRCTGKIPKEDSIWQEFEDSAVRNTILSGMATMLAPVASAGAVSFGLVMMTVVGSSVVIAKLQQKARESSTSLTRQIFVGFVSAPRYIIRMFWPSNEIDELRTAWKWDTCLMQIPPELQCQICLELLGDDGQRRNPCVFVCGQFFCKSCIYEWVRKEGRTPYNKQISIVELDEMVGDASESSCRRRLRKHQLQNDMQLLIRQYAASRNIRLCLQ